MRTLVVGTLAATLVGCSCVLPPQTVMEACMDPNGLACFKAVATQPIEPKPASFKANSAPIKAKTAIAENTEKPQSDDIRGRPHFATKKSKSTLATAKVELPASGQAAEQSDPVTTIAKTEIAAKTEKPPSDDERDNAHLATTKAKSTMAAAKIEPPVIGRAAEPSDQVITMAKTAIAAKLEVPASAEFGEMKRAFRKNTLGKSVDSICGRVKGKKASGEDTGDRPFLYLVKEDDAYVVDGPPRSAAASAYRNICS
ncbi:MAG TPA: hypothetical protein VKC60_07410 [Opitutaceae bacterium]|nr:hypothetical protein [Opitutaceae bacterium]